VDYGDSNNRRRDIIAYPLEAKFARDKFDGNLKELHDPYHWDIKNRFAVEAETASRKNQKQLLKNYEKCFSPFGQYSRVIFYIGSAKHRNDVQELLKGRPSSTFEVTQLDAERLGLKKRELETELAL
jgi:hypothetical protein